MGNQSLWQIQFCFPPIQVTYRYVYLKLVLSYYEVNSKLLLRLLFYSQGLISQIQKYICEKEKQCWIICSVLSTQLTLEPSPTALFRCLLVPEAGSGHIHAPQNSVELLADILNILDLLFSWEGNKFNTTTTTHLLSSRFDCILSPAASSWLSLSTTGGRDFYLPKWQVIT